MLACILDAQPIQDATIKKGDEFADAELYSQATTYYLDALTTLSGHSDSESKQLTTYTKYQLAQAYIRSDNNKAALPVLLQLVSQNPSGQTHSDAVYLLALTYKNLKSYPEAKETFQSYLSETPLEQQTYGIEAQFQLGLVEFLRGDLAAARKTWEPLKSSAKGNIGTLVQLYLARIELSNKQEQKALTLLKTVLLAKHPDFINSEAHFLMGTAYYQLGDYKHAIKSFELSLPESNPSDSPWYGDALQLLGRVHLALGTEIHGSLEEQQNHLLSAKEAFEKLFTYRPDEESALELGNSLTTLAKRFPGENFYEEARNLLSKNDIILSSKARFRALMLTAQAAPSFTERDTLFSRLVRETIDPQDVAKAWFMKGKNEYDEGLQLTGTEKSMALFVRAAEAFGKAAALYPKTELQEIASAKKYQAISLTHLHKEHADVQVLTLLREIPSLPNESPKDHAEMLYLEGIVASRLIPAQESSSISTSEDLGPYFIQAVKALEAASALKDSTYSDLALKHLGALHYHLGNYAEAERTYLLLANDHPNSSLCGEGWFWGAKCAQQLDKDREVSRERKKNVYETHPNSPYAPEAYLSMYSTAEYLQGDRTSNKHLQNFIGKFPDSPLQIEAHYLLGLDLKRDRKTAEGKWIRKRNLMEAIDAFQEVENFFTKFTEREEIPLEQQEYFIKVRYQATLERALANLAIANESSGAKKTIYLEYAEEVFKGLNKDLENPENSYAKILQQEGQVSPIYEESLFGLAQTNIKAKRDGDAQKVLEHLQAKYQELHITRGYYLSRLWYELGMIASRKQMPRDALQFLQKAEEASKGDVLSTDQKLDLWIQQSLCYRSLGDYDHCILLLSKTINDDAVSSLRLKAMFLRAETYEQQGRPELARKQLESLAKKGGYWGKEAKQKMTAAQKIEVHHGH
jgi:tetratricopeptide (TPR) repeat protein